MLHKQAVYTNTVNSKAQHSQFDFCFRFLLLHILAQGEKMELVLFQHLIPVPDLQKMPHQIESELLPNMHLPIPSLDPLHFYRYLWSHVLVEENQFLLLIDVPIKDRAQQIQIYKIINLPVPVGNYSMRYTMDNKYLGVTYDRTKAMDIPEDQFKLCKEANGSFAPS